tara:strand:- start:49 stop:588 length:540 start_codon:yes stop_codon:yes gene_type:complete
MADGILKVGTITTSSGSGNIAIGSGVTLQSNVPAFEAVMSADVDFSRDTVTKINFNTEVFDTNSAYDNSTNYRFTVPSGNAGKYYTYLTLGLKTGASSNFEYAGIYLYKNGSAERVVWIDLRAGDGRDIPLNLTTTLDLSVGDYLEPYAYVVTTSGDATIMGVRGSTKLSVFGAYRIGA